MSSYLSPQIDHNLYNPILPQNPIGEIFNLMGVKQQMYNSNLAQVNTQISSMNDLSSAVTNDNVREKVVSFNKEANELLKQYSSLDFSIQDNVNAIDKLYNPLINDSDFITDYSATTHARSEIQKGFSKRDSSKKEERDQFSITNIDYVMAPLSDLKSAKNTKELKLASEKVRNRYYVPYTDVRKNMMDNLESLTKDGKAELSYSTAQNGYIITLKNGANSSYAQSLNDWLNATMSDNDKRQLQIEATVELDKMVSSLGKENVVTSYIQQSVNTTDAALKQIEDLKKENSELLKVMPPINKMTNAQKEEYQLLQNSLTALNAKQQLYTKRKDEIQKTFTKLQNDVFNYDDILDLAVTDLTENKVSELTDKVSSSYAKLNGGVSLAQDQAYATAHRLSYDYWAKQLEDKWKTNELLDKEKDRQVTREGHQKDLAIAGLKYDKDGNVVPDLYPTADISTTPFEYMTDLLNTKGGVVEIQSTLIDEYKKLYEQLHPLPPGVNHYDWDSPESKKLLQRFIDPNADLSTWRSEYRQLRDKYMDKYREGISNYKIATEELSQLVLDYNKENPEHPLQFDNKTGQVTAKNAVSKIDKLSNALDINTGGPLELLGAVKNIFVSDGSSNEDQIEKFKTFVNKNAEKNGSLFLGQGVSARGASARQLLNEMQGSIQSFNNSYSSGLAGLEKYNSTEGLEDGVLDLAYQGILKLNNAPNKDINPYVKFSNSKKGTLMAFPDAKIEDVFGKVEDNKYTDAQRQAYKIITDGLNIPLVHDKYFKANPTEAKLRSGKPIDLNNSFTIRQNVIAKSDKDAFVITPKYGKSHYMYEFIKEDAKIELEVTQDANGKAVYSLIGSSDPIYLDQTTALQRASKSELSTIGSTISARTEQVENDNWRGQLTKTIKKNSTFIEEENGKYFITFDKLKTLLK